MGKKSEPMTLSLKSSKTEILEAYENLKAKHQEFTSQQTIDKKVDDLIRSEEKKVVEKASTYTVEKIIRDLADLNLQAGKALTDLAERLTQEANKLSDLQKAIEIETRYLEELRDVRVASDTLALLIQEHETRQLLLEEEMIRKREEWKKEQASHEATLKERDAIITKERQREKEEYEYNLALARKKEKDAYEQEKTMLTRALKEEKEKQEKAFAEREAALAAREAELKELRQKAETFQTALENAVKEAQEKTQAAERERAEGAAKLAAKDAEGEKRVLELKILSLQEVVNKQAAQVESLARQLTEANNQVQAIAVKAIEGASGARTLSTVQEIALEQAKQAKTPK